MPLLYDLWKDKVWYLHDFELFDFLVLSLILIQFQEMW